MGVASTLKDLRALSDDELIRRHDEEAAHTVVGTDYYLAELARRESHKTAEGVARDTTWMKRLTAIITALTIANVGLVAWVAFR
jgi:hypothetical protein